MPVKRRFEITTHSGGSKSWTKTAVAMRQRHRAPPTGASLAAVPVFAIMALTLGALTLREYLRSYLSE